MICILYFSTYSNNYYIYTYYMDIYSYHHWIIQQYFKPFKKKIKVINVPSNWFPDIQLHGYPNKTFVGFYTLGLRDCKKTFLRYIEKQLVLTEGRGRN